MIDKICRPDVFIIIWNEDFFPLEEQEKERFFSGLKSFIRQNFVLKLYFEGSLETFREVETKLSDVNVKIAHKANLLKEDTMTNILDREESATHILLLGDHEHFEELIKEFASWHIKISLITHKFKEHYRVSDINFYNIHSLRTLEEHPNNWWLYQAQ